MAVMAAITRGREGGRASRAITAIKAAQGRVDERARGRPPAERERRGERKVELEVEDGADMWAPAGSERERRGGRGVAGWAGWVVWATGKRKRGGEKKVGWAERRRKEEREKFYFVLFSNLNTI